MEAEIAIEIIQRIADGVDPYSGERLPADSFQLSSTVHVLDLAFEAPEQRLRRLDAAPAYIGECRLLRDNRAVIRYTAEIGGVFG